CNSTSIALLTFQGFLFLFFYSEYPESDRRGLSFNDCFTSKLLSNSDRYMDNSVEARDLIDLAILRLQSPIPQASIDKAEKAYEVMRPLSRA
ncbi:MAG: nucleotidyl transferase AbiEii/AbiGii toxin family protein, partial [Nostoc sp.]